MIKFTMQGVELFLDQSTGVVQSKLNQDDPDCMVCSLSIDGLQEFESVLAEVNLEREKQCIV